MVKRDYGQMKTGLAILGIAILVALLVAVSFVYLGYKPEDDYDGEDFYD